jgi:uncharacterized protein (DUF952 family)
MLAHRGYCGSYDWLLVMNNRIYHITSEHEANGAKISGVYVPPDFEREGFIHCSYAHQLEGVIRKRFQNRTDLVVLEIDPAQLTCEVIDENLEGGTELFPHIYGRLPMSIVKIRSIQSIPGLSFPPI